MSYWMVFCSLQGIRNNLYQLFSLIPCLHRCWFRHCLFIYSEFPFAVFCFCFTLFFEPLLFLFYKRLLSQCQMLARCAADLLYTVCSVALTFTWSRCALCLKDYLSESPASYHLYCLKITRNHPLSILKFCIDVGLGAIVYGASYEIAPERNSTLNGMQYANSIYFALKWFVSKRKCFIRKQQDNNITWSR